MNNSDFPAIKFGTPDKIFWDEDEARFFVEDHDRRVLCRVTLEWLEDTFQISGSDDALTVARENFDRITDVILASFRSLAQPDGTILLCSIPRNQSLRDIS